MWHIRDVLLFIFFTYSLSHLFTHYYVDKNATYVYLEEAEEEEKDEKEMRIHPRGYF